LNKCLQEFGDLFFVVYNDDFKPAAHCTSPLCEVFSVILNCITPVAAMQWFSLFTAERFPLIILRLLSFFMTEKTENYHYSRPT